MYSQCYHRYYITGIHALCAVVLLAGCNPESEGGTTGRSGKSGDGSDTTASIHAKSTEVNRAPAKKKPGPSDTVGPYGHNAADYVLTFSDEFENGFDRAKWNDTTWDKPSNPTINYAVEGGSLKIWPQRDAGGRFFDRVIDTDGKFYQTYGYYEIEAKLPKGKGTWPAFWLYNHDDEKGTFRPEIDIMEAYAGGGPESGWSDSKLRPTAYAVTVWTGVPEVKAGSKMLQDLGDLSAKFHKYALKWEPNKQTFYFDGKEVYTLNVSMPHRMYVMLDLLFGSASGDPDHTTPTGKSNSFEVKYVRVWQMKNLLKDQPEPKGHQVPSGTTAK